MNGRIPLIPIIESKVREKIPAERGTAMLEFMIVLPFLLTMIFGVVDLSRAISQYMMLSEAVSQGVRYAGSVSNLSGSVNTEYRDLTPAQHCDTSMPKSFSRNVINPSREHEQIQQRVEDLLLQGSTSLDLDTLCIRSEVMPASGGAEMNVHLEAQANFNSILPLLQGISLRAQATGPYMFPNG